MLRDLFSLFPAYAGVILAETSKYIAKPAFPRIRGGDPTTIKTDIENINFSPHTRG